MEEENGEAFLGAYGCDHDRACMYRTGTATVALASHLVCSSAFPKEQQARAPANSCAPLPTFGWNKQKRPTPHVAAVRSGISDGDAETFHARCMALIRYATHVVTVCRFHFHLRLWSSVLRLLHKRIFSFPAIALFCVEMQLL